PFSVRSQSASKGRRLNAFPDFPQRVAMHQHSDPLHRTEKRDAMIVEWDAPISASDGVALRADIFRPDNDGRHPVILTYGPYGKGLAFQDGNASAWTRM